LRGFYVALGMNPINKSPNKTCYLLDAYARRVGRFLSHQSDRGLPRTYFPFGITGNNKMAGHEYQGVLLVILCLCHMQDSKNLMLTKMTPGALRGWIRLFELLLGWRSWLKLESMSRVEAIRSAFATQNLMELFRVTVARTAGNGTLFIKIHLPRHFAEYMLWFGVMANVDTGPEESNHKGNAKDPCHHTQMRAEVVEIQTALRYIENLYINWASDALDGKTNDAQMAPNPTDNAAEGLKGARFVFTIDAGPTGVNNVVGFKWKSKDMHKLYPMQYTHWLTRHLFSKLPPGSAIRGCTEHKRENKYLFRAHPAYRGHNQWHDWALFEWANDAGETGDDADDEPYTIPGQIILFLDLPASAVGMDVGEETRIESAGMYALIETLEDPLPLRSKRTEIVVPSKKKLTAAQQRKRRRDHRRVITPNIFLVPVETIYEPISALPDIGGEVGDFIFVRPADTWSYCFSDFIDMCHDD
jgi:hypothetical protein